VIALLALLAYFALMLLLGWQAERGREQSAREYYLAGSGLASVALFFALFGTNCSPFVLLGVPGMSYHEGLAIFSLNAPIIALGVPLLLWWMGQPARRLSLELGALSPAELYSRKLGSRAVGWVLFGSFTLFTLPYMVTGIAGCGLALESVFPEVLSREVGAALSLGVALAYTLMGGMRATAWTNIVQGALFLGVILLVGVLLFIALGGPAAAFERLLAERPELSFLDRDAPRTEWKSFLSTSINITLTVACFPHMLVRLMAARDDRSLRASMRLYPLALALLWLPAVLIGVFGALLRPGLEGKASDGVFPWMVGELLGPQWAVLGTLAVLAAAMSTLDAQLLTLGSMLERDVRGVRRKGGERLFLLGVAVLTFALYLAFEASEVSIFGLSNFAFSGYVMLFPTLVLGLHWNGLTARGAVLSMLGGIGTLALASLGWFPTLGFQPVVPGLTMAFALAWVGSLGGTGRLPRPSAQATNRRRPQNGSTSQPRGSEVG